MLLSTVILLAGLLLLIVGASSLVKGASALAAALGVSPIVIGLTVVAFGTSMPEVVINVTAAAHDQTDLAFGNLVGACAINLAFVLALTALIRPLAVEPSIITRELPMMLLAVAAIVVLSEDSFLGTGTVDALDRSDGIVLLLFFSVFLYYTIVAVLNRGARDPFIEEVKQEAREKAPERRSSTAMDVGRVLGGLVGLTVGGRLAVAGAVQIAESLNVPEVIIGLTLVSLGTTAPELTTCIVAARRGHGDIAIGNVVGSNIFNLLFVSGVVATIRPIDLPPGAQFDLLYLALLSAVMLPIAIRGPRRIVRSEAALLLASYIAYVATRLLWSPAAAAAA